jgi:hypothetical protein
MMAMRTGSLSRPRTTELWAIVAKHSGLVGAWRLTGVCRASREGAKEWLRTLPGLVVCGGRVGDGFTFTSDVWRLNLAELRWEPMPSLTRGRAFHSCCAVRGAVVVLGGLALGQEGPREPYAPRAWRF